MKQPELIERYDVCGETIRKLIFRKTPAGAVLDSPAGALFRQRFSNSFLEHSAKTPLEAAQKNVSDCESSLRRCEDMLTKAQRRLMAANSVLAKLHAESLTPP